MAFLGRLFFLSRLFGGERNQREFAHSARFVRRLFAVVLKDRSQGLDAYFLSRLFGGELAER